MALPVGLHFDLPPDLYHSDPAEVPSLSASIAHTLVSKSPIHAWMQHPKLGGRGKKPTRAMDLGSVVHALLLGAGKEYAVITAPDGEPEFEDFKRKSAREARDAVRAEGKVPLLPRQYEEALAVADGIKPRLSEFGIELNGRSEVAAIWHERASNGKVVVCRGCMDHFDEKCATIFDLKIVRSAHPKACQSHLVGFGGDVQSAAYVSAVETLRPHLAGRIQFVFLFCEAEPPNCVTPVFRLGSMREFGERRWQRAVNRWESCLSNGRWPGYVDEPIGVEAPAWAMAAEEELMFSGNTVASGKPDGPSEAHGHQFTGDGSNDGSDDLLGVF